MRLAVTRLLGRSAGAVALHNEDFRTLRRVRRTVGEFARQAQFSRAGGILALNFSFRPALQPVFPPVQDKVEQGFATFHIVRSEESRVGKECVSTCRSWW